MDRNENIEMKRILNILKSKKILIAFILIVFTLFGYLYSYYYITPKYRSTSTLLLIPNNTSENSGVTTSDLTLNSGLIYTYSSIAKQSRVLKQVIYNLNLDITEEELLNQLQVKVINDTYIIEIAVEHVQPQTAMRIAQELSNVFLNEIKEIYNLNNIGIVDEAELPSNPYNINHLKDMVIFFCIGSIVSFVCIIGIYIFDNTIKTEEDIEEYVQMKSLGKIPMNINKKEEIIDKNNAKSYITECINTIRTNILYMGSVKDAKTILVTSCNAADGKSWVSANIATSFAETNKKVLLIDADMRKGRANKIFGVKNTDGLSNYLYFMTGNIKSDIELARNYIQETQIPNLHILTNGTVPPNPSELLDSKNMKELIYLVKNMYDIIIVDAPPCKLVTDSIVLSTIIDSTILVASSENTKISELKEAKKAIKIVGGKVIGVIVNKVKVTGKIYSKSYYYGHIKEEDKPKVEERERISVEQIIEQLRLKLDKQDILFKENKEKAIEEEKISDSEENIIQVARSQEQDWELIKEAILDIKEKIYNREVSDKNSKREIRAFANKKIEEWQENSKIQNINYIDILNRISTEIEKVNEKDYINEFEKVTSKLDDIKLNANIDYENAFQKISEELESAKENYKQIIKYVKNINYISSFMGSINRERLTKAQIQGIIKQEMENIDYTKQISQINEMITALNNNYLELSNRLITNNIEEERVNNKNIIDIKLLKKQKREKKKEVFSLDEDISYEELEKTAFCIIPFPKNNIIAEDYNETVAMK